MPMVSALDFQPEPHSNGFDSQHARDVWVSAFPIKPLSKPYHIQIIASCNLTMHFREIREPK